LTHGAAKKRVGPAWQKKFDGQLEVLRRTTESQFTMVARAINERAAEIGVAAAMAKPGGLVADRSIWHGGSRGRSVRSGDHYSSHECSSTRDEKGPIAQW
jgi:hypothetical protein